MTVGTHKLTLPADMLRRGFWLYTWRVVGPAGEELLYVGRTGDNSSPNASPAYIRMGQHLGSLDTQNALRKHLAKRDIFPEQCRHFELVCHGPIYPEIEKPANFSREDRLLRKELMEKHIPLRNIVGAMEKQLANDLAAADYTVLNTVPWPHDVDPELWKPIRAAFAEHFPKLRG
ncbi:hypothetical protein HFN60_13385 [Rhizobium leguminosarum]|uniref:hypothetical protein n=1 Tax=Rhizobium leguminosarum TaxID=384 RepID=UPI001C98C234|nr:hypothetical protein [Rhizobium leguminosarum]MBY5816630.1 hypothetical protein [Rhizobium leguminosarum]